MKMIRPFTVTPAALTVCNVPETDYPVYAAGTTYAAEALVLKDHKIWESLQSGNIGNDPATAPTWWLDRGFNNRWRMFDQVVGSQTEHAGDITFTLNTIGRVNTIGFLNVYATSIRVVATDAVDGVVFDRTVDMRSNEGINDWWSYFYEPQLWESDEIITDLPAYSGLTLSVTITGIDGVTKVGVCIIGLSKTIGTTQYGASVGIQDYSVKTRDSWGNATVLERAFSKRANFTVHIDNGTIDRLQSLLAQYRATPILYIGSDEFGSTAVLGFYKDFSITIAYFSYSVCTIEIEGLI